MNKTYVNFNSDSCAVFCDNMMPVLFLCFTYQLPVQSAHGPDGNVVSGGQGAAANPEKQGMRHSETSGCVNANFYVHHASKSCRTQNHGSDAYSVRRKAGLGLDTSQINDMNAEHGRHSSNVKGQHSSFANKIYFAESFDERGGKMLSKCVSVSFRWYAFPNFVSVCKFPIHFRAVCTLLKKI